MSTRIPTAKLTLASPRETWEREYTELRVIPTSTRTSPSRALLLFAHFLGSQHPLKILDAGAGTGRNSLYLARHGHDVYAQDFSTNALDTLSSAAKELGLEPRIHIVESPLEQSFPYSDETFDLVLDSYVLCHFVDDLLKRHYLSEARRVLRPRGRLFSSLFSIEDEYYRELIHDLHGSNPVVVDPRNGIAKQLFTEKSIKDLYSTSFTMCYFAKFEFDDVAVGENYHRSVFASVMEKLESDP